MLCQQCGNAIEEGRRGRAPVLAKFCLKCRSERRRLHSLKYVWLPQHEAYLRAHYHGGLHQRSRAIRALIQQTSFPRWYIKRQASRLPLTMHPDGRPWTQQEFDTLGGLLGKVSTATIAKRLKRTEASVILKITALGYSRRVSEGYTTGDLEKCLGEDHHKIQKWIAKGWLRARSLRKHRDDANRRSIHCFRERDILDFIKRHPREINLCKVDSLWMLDLFLLRGMELQQTTIHQQKASYDGDEEET